MSKEAIHTGLLLFSAAVFSMTLSARVHGTDDECSVRSPGLEWATYYGGADSEVGEAIAVAPDGTLVIAGFILALSPFDIDAYVARFSPDGTTLLDLFLLDGLSIEGAFGVGVDQNGVVTVVGQTTSPDFPTTPDAIQSAYMGGGGDGFVVQLSPSFDLLYSTYFGGSGEDAFTDLAMDEAGRFALCGYTGSPDLPLTPGAFQESYGGGALDAFVVQFASGEDGCPQLTYATFLGGSGDDSDFDPAAPYGKSLDERLLRQAVCFTPQGNIVVAGMTWSEDFPVTPGAWQTAHSEYNDTYEENADIYLTVLNPRAVGTPLRQLVYSTYIGGAQRDVAEDLAVRHLASVVLVGLSRSPDFPVTANAHQDSLNGPQDAVVMELLPLPQIPKKVQIAYSTFFGGSAKDAANGVHLLVSGDIAVGGVTTSPDFPTTDGTSMQPPTDLFMVRLDPSRDPTEQVVLSTLIGGSGGDDLMVGPVGNGLGDVFFTGDTWSADFPGVDGSFQEFFGGGFWDAVLGQFYIGGLGRSKAE